MIHAKNCEKLSNVEVTAKILSVPFLYINLTVSIKH